jgi:hypothetical protein
MSYADSHADPKCAAQVSFRSSINLNDLRHKKSWVNGIGQQGHDHGIRSMIVRQQGLWYNTQKEERTSWTRSSCGRAPNTSWQW